MIKPWKLQFTMTFGEQDIAAYIAAVEEGQWEGPASQEGFLQFIHDDLWPEYIGFAGTSDMLDDRWWSVSEEEK